MTAPVWPWLKRYKNNRVTATDLQDFVSRLNDLAAPGSIRPFAGSTAPSGYLLCTGGTQPVASYPTLASLLGTTYGGDGETTFGIPDLRGRVLIGANSSYPLGDTGGAFTTQTIQTGTGSSVSVVTSSGALPVPWAAVNYLIKT